MHDPTATSGIIVNSVAAQSRAAHETRRAFTSFKPSSDDDISLLELTATKACIRIELVSRLPDIALTWWAARGLFQGALVSQRFPALSQRAGLVAFLPALLMGIFQVTNTHRSLRCLIPTITSATPVGEALREVYAAHAPVGDPLSIAAARIAASQLGHGSLPAERLARKDALIEELAKVTAETVKPMKRDIQGERAVSSSTITPSPKHRQYPSSSKAQGLDDLRAGTATNDDDDRFASYPSDDSWSNTTTAAGSGDDSSGFLSSAVDNFFEEKNTSTKKGVRISPPRNAMSSATSSSVSSASSSSPSSSSSDNNNSDVFHGLFGDSDDEKKNSSLRSDNNTRALGDEARWRERNRLPQKHEHEDIHPSYDIRRKRRESISEDNRYSSRG